MIRKPIAVALATLILTMVPVLLSGAVRQHPVHENGMLAAVQPAPTPTYPEWLLDGGYPEPDWPALERCWTDRFTSPNATPPGCSGQYPLTLPCDWRIEYPSRFWVEQGCGRIASWSADFGSSWWGQWERHPAKDWVARLRAGGQP